MATVFVYLESSIGVPLTGASPVLDFWDKSTPAAPTTGVSMTELTNGIGGGYFADIATTDGREYFAIIDGTVAATVRFHTVSFSGETDARIEVDVPAILVDTDATIPGLIAAVQADTDDIQTRLPAALVAGRMDSDVAVIQTDAVDADALAADAVAEIQSGLATATNVLDASRWVHGVGGYDGTVLSVVAYARKNGLALLTVTAATIEVFAANEDSLIGPVAMSGPTSQGVLRASVTPSPALILDVGSYIEVVVSDPGGDFSGVIPLARQT